MSAQAPAHFYWVQGDEYVLVNQACRRLYDRYPDAARRAVRIDSTIDWPALAQEAASADLFSAQTLWHIDFFDQIPDAKALDFTRNLVFEALAIERSQEPATILVYSSGILKSAQRKSKWYTKLAAAGGIEILWPMNRRQAQSWARKQMDAHRIHLDDSALAYLMDKTETNLTLLDKELYKLSLAAGNKDNEAFSNFDLDQVRRNVEGDHSRFSPFALVTTALLEPLDKFVRMVGYFENEGQDINQLLGALRFSLNQLIDFSAQAKDGQDPSSLMRYLPREQQNLLGECLRRYNGASLVGLLLDLTDTEKSARGISPLRPWDALRRWGRRVHSLRASGRIRPSRARPAPAY